MKAVPPGFILPRDGLTLALRCLVRACSVVSDSFVIPWTVTCQAPLSIEFSRQEYWSGLPFPTPGDLHDPGIEPASPESPALAGRFFTTAAPGKPFSLHDWPINQELNCWGKDE